MFNEANEVMTEEQVARLKDATEGSKYLIWPIIGLGEKIVIIWKGGSAINAYTCPDYIQFSHWNIDFPMGATDEEKRAIVKRNIDEHVEENNFPN